MMKIFAATLALALGLGAGVCFADPPTATPTVVPDGVTLGGGDVNSDGATNIGDALRVGQIVALGLAPSVVEFLEGDTNMNGRLDLEDAELIGKADVGQITLPVRQFLPGDANSSGKVTSRDVVTLNHYLHNEDVPRKFSPYNADANQDNYIDKRDIDAILDIIAGR